MEGQKVKKSTNPVNISCCKYLPEKTISGLNGKLTRDLCDAGTDAFNHWAMKPFMVAGQLSPW